MPQPPPRPLWPPSPSRRPRRRRHSPLRLRARSPGSPPPRLRPAGCSRRPGRRRQAGLRVQLHLQVVGVHHVVVRDADRQRHRHQPLRPVRDLGLLPVLVRSSPSSSLAVVRSGSQFASIRSKSAYLMKLYQMSVFLWTVAPLHPSPPPLQLPGSSPPGSSCQATAKPTFLALCAIGKNASRRPEVRRSGLNQTTSPISRPGNCLRCPPRRARRGTPTGRSRESRRCPGRPRPCPRRSRRSPACRARPRRRSRRTRRRRGSRRRS